MTQLATPTLTRVSMEDVVAKTRQRYEALKPFDVADSLKKYEYRFADGKPLMTRVGGTEKDGPQVLNLTPRALTQLLGLANIPVKFFRDTCPEGLQYYIANTLIQRDFKPSDLNLLRTVYGDQVRAVLGNGYTPLDDIDVMPIIADILADEKATVMQCDMGEEATHLRIVFDDQEQEVKPGDWVNRGLHITNSEVGLRAIRVHETVYRQICTNGLMGWRDEDKMRMIHRGSRDKLKDWLATAVRDAKNNTNRLVDQFAQSINHALVDPFGLVKDQARDLSITEGQLENILAAFNKEPDRSLFGAVNAVTRAAQAEEKWENRYQLELAGTRILQRGTR